MNDSRRLSVAVGLSLLVHALLVAIPARQPAEPPPAPQAPPPLTVRLTPPEPAPVEAPRAPEPARVEAPPPPVAPPPVARPPVSEPKPAPPRREPRPPPVVRQPSPQPAPEPPLPVPEPPPRAPGPPPVDMLAAIEARREARRAAESASPMPPVEKPPEDAVTRNLRTLSGSEGVSGVFQVLRKGVRTGEFAFNGWLPEASSQWRQVIEVDAGPGGDVELALARGMIKVIRTHYTGDFNWDSRRLGRIVVLSARPEDNAGLEDFLMREFFDRPAPARR